MLQLQCVGGDACGNYKLTPRTVQCKNRGSDDNGMIQWKCEADLDEKVRFGKVEVNCEGYRFAGDENVLRGSCGLEYELWYTEKGMNQQAKQQQNSYNNYQQPPRQQQQYQQPRHDYDYVREPSYERSGIGGLIGFIVIVVIFIGCIKLCGPRGNTPTVIRAAPSNPPPSYSNMYPSAPSYTPDFNPEYTQTTSTTTTTSTGSGLLGPAVGAAAGFGAGYLLGRSQSSAQPQPQPVYRETIYPTTTTTYYDDSDDRTHRRRKSDDDDDSTTRTATAYGGTKSR
jgi:hypothetical protein